MPSSSLKIDNFDNIDDGCLDQQSVKSINESGKNNILFNKMPSSSIALKIDSTNDLEEHNATIDNNSRGSSLDKSDQSSISGNSGASSAKSSGNNINNMKITSDRVEEELSQLWDSGQEWILIFDNLLKHPGGKVGKGCKCDMCEMQKGGPTNNGHGCYNNDSAFESLENSLSGK